MRLSFFVQISLAGIAAAHQTQQLSADMDLAPQIMAQLEDPDMSIDDILAQLDTFEAENGSCALVDELSM